MRRPVYAYRYVHGAFERLEQQLLGDLLRTFAKDQGPPAADGSFPIDLPAEVAGVSVEKQVRVRTGAARRSGSRVVLPVGWHAEPASAVFPAFDGDIELLPLSRGTAQLTVVGSYRLPLGAVGAAADAAALHGVAEHTVTWLVDELVARLEEGPAPAAPVEGDSHVPRLRVADVMSRNPLILHPDLPTKTAALILYHADVSGAPVVAVDGTLVGVLSEQDLLAKEASRRWGWGRGALRELSRREAATVADACSKPARTTVPDATLADAAREMLDRRVNRLVVLDRARVAGMVTRHDVLAALIRDDADVHAAVSGLIAAQGHEHVSAEVEWGAVTLTGVIELRSAADVLVEDVQRVEGVTAVDTSQLTRRYDDVVPEMPLPHL